MSEKTVARNLFWSYFAQGWSAVINIILLPQIMRRLGGEAFGLIAFYTMLSTWISIFEGSVAPVVLKTAGSAYASDRGLFDRLVASIRSTCLVVGLGTLVAHLAFANVLYEGWLRAPGLSKQVAITAIALMGCVSMFRIQEVTYRNLLMALERHSALNRLTVVSVTLKALGTLISIYLSTSNVAVYFVGQVLAGAISLAFFFFTCRRTYISSWAFRDFDLGLVRTMFRFGGALLCHNMLVLVISQTDRILLLSLLPLKSFGYYSLVFSVAYALFMLIGPIVQVFQPKIYNAVATSSRESLVANFHLGSHVVSLACTSVACFIAIFSRDVLALYTSDQALASGYANCLSLLIIGNLVNGLLWILNVTFFAHSSVATIIRLNLVFLPFYACAGVLLFPSLGVHAFPVAWIVINVAMCVVLPIIANRTFLQGEMRDWIVKDVAWMVLSVCTVLVVLRWSITVSSHPFWAIFQLGGLLAVASIAGMMSSGRMRTMTVSVLRDRMQVNYGK
jgi:O-antigen/teichoic acid export membrane protein